MCRAIADHGGRRCAGRTAAARRAAYAAMAPEKRDEINARRRARRAARVETERAEQKRLDDAIAGAIERAQAEHVAFETWMKRAGIVTALQREVALFGLEGVAARWGLKPTRDQLTRDEVLELLDGQGPVLPDGETLESVRLRGDGLVEATWSGPGDTTARTRWARAFATWLGGLVSSWAVRLG